MKLPPLFKSFTCPHLSQDLTFIKNLHGDQVNLYNARSIWMCNKCHKLVYQDRLFDLGSYSDGYHTFDELYHHRTILFAVLCHNYKDICWKSSFHHDGTMYENMFIVGIETPEGPATYHCDLRYWKLFDVKELDKAPEWDGHSPEESINRISSLLNVTKKEKEIVYIPAKTVEPKKKKFLGFF